MTTRTVGTQSPHSAPHGLKFALEIGLLLLAALLLSAESASAPLF